ncbi:MAG: endosialidase [Lachnospiraceae bacterium]|nr:endosialidase [Lachnospiraceae bacterium]
MAVVEQLLRSEADGSISFGNHALAHKAKLEDYEHGGDLYKVKTFSTMTKLEKNGMFLYESVPGTSVNQFSETGNGMKFVVEGASDAQITLGLSDDTEYEVFVAGNSVGTMKTGLGGKLSISAELEGMGEVEVKVVEA